MLLSCGILFDVVRNVFRFSVGRSIIRVDVEFVV